jgi:hypothetical protein
VANVLGYTDLDNPFGDTNLKERFVWKKKSEQQSAQGMSQREQAKLERKQRQQLQLELQKAKERREEREQEKLRWEEEMRRVQREREAETYQDWEQKEAEFHMQQAKRRAEIRIAEGRPRPIDILYKNLAVSSDFDFDMQEPYTIFYNLQLDELVELSHDIRMYQELDSNKEFWAAMSVVCDDELARAREGKARRGDSDARFDGGVHSSIDTDVKQILQGKSFAELQQLEQSIIATLTGGATVDVEYWEALLKRLVVFKAKARLREIHAELLQQRLEILRQQQQEQTEEVVKEYERKLKSIHDRAPLSPPPSTTSTSTSTSTSAAAGDGDDAQFIAGDDEYESDEDYEEGDLQPLGPEDDAIDDADDRAQLALQRQRVLEQQARRLQERVAVSSRMDRSLTPDDLYLMESQRELGLDEEVFASEFDLAGKVYSWHDKFRPRKPKYFNRVKTGYEWNKYNQTHYDRMLN